VDHYYGEIEGWCDYEDVYRMAIDTASHGAVFVEIGAWKGKSAAYAGVEIINSGKDITLHVVDHFKGSDEHRNVGSVWYESRLTEDPDWLYNTCVKNTEPVSEVVKIIRKTSAQAAKGFKANSVDFVFIDGSHDTASVLADIDAWLPKVKPNGIIAGHDYSTHESVRNAVNQRFPVGVHRPGMSWYYYKQGEE
jgi:hypothetical protein